MKKSTLTLAVLLLTFLAFGQTNINDLERIDGLWTKKGEKTAFTGAFVEYFDNGKIKGKGEFKKGLVDGLRLTYYENGQIKTEKKYIAGQTEGKSTEYFDNGKTKQEGEFKNGKEEGAWKLYHENGTLKAVLTFADGVQHGDYFEYSTDGQLKAQYYFVNGKASYSPEFLDLAKQALALSRQFKNEEAIKLYDKAIALNPTVPKAYFNRGVCKSSSFDFEGAIKDYDKAIELNPEYMEAYGNRGSAKINTFTSKGNLEPTPEQTESACDDFHKAVSLGDKTIATEDMIYLYCKKNKKEKEIMGAAQRTCYAT
jgi:tetratricopeptide (TPR) repeat protein